MPIGSIARIGCILNRAVTRALIEGGECSFFLGLPDEFFRNQLYLGLISRETSRAEHEYILKKFNNCYIYFMRGLMFM